MSVLHHHNDYDLRRSIFGSFPCTCRHLSQPRWRSSTQLPTPPGSHRDGAAVPVHGVTDSLWLDAIRKTRFIYLSARQGEHTPSRQPKTPIFTVCYADSHTKSLPTIYASDLNLPAVCYCLSRLVALLTPSTPSPSVSVATTRPQS